MKATNFLLDPPGLDDAWAPQPERDRSLDATKRSPGLFERFDRWLWRQQLRAREAYLAQSKDIFELEQRIRSLERADGRRSY